MIRNILNLDVITMRDRWGAGHPPLRHLDLNLLRVLVEIRDAGGVSVAGERLHLSQPAVSNALARLRVALDDPLFVRGARGFTPTPYTERILPAVRDTLARLSDALAREPRFEPALSSREFRVAMTDAGTLVFLPKLVALLAAEAPQVRLEIVPLTFDVIEGALGDGAVDLAIGPLAIREGADLRIETLFRETYAGLVRRGGGLAKAAGAARKLPLRVIHGARIAALVQTHTRHRTIIDTLVAAGLEGNVIARVPQFVALPSLVAGYDALAIVPSEIATLFEERGQGQRVDLALRLPAYDVVQARHRRHDRDAGLAWLAALAGRALGKPVRAPGRRARAIRRP